MSPEADTGNAVDGIGDQGGEKAVGAEVVTHPVGQHHQWPLPDHFVGDASARDIHPLVGPF